MSESGGLGERACVPNKSGHIDGINDLLGSVENSFYALRDEVVRMSNKLYGPKPEKEPGTAEKEAASACWLDQVAGRLARLSNHIQTARAGMSNMNDRL